MKKKILAVMMAAVMTLSLAACGGDTTTSSSSSTSTSSGTSTTTTTSSDTSTAAKTDTSADAADDAMTDDTFAALQEGYSALVDAYNAVAEVYASDDIAQSDEIEEHLQQAADLIDELGEIEQDSLNESDADDIVEAIDALLDYLEAILDGMTLADDASGDMMTDDTFAALQSCYDVLVEYYNEVIEVYSSEEVAQSDEIEENLQMAAELIEELGDIDQSSLAEDDAEEVLEAMEAIVDYLSEILDAM